ncbi:peroxisomal membrane protein 2-like [Corticium candelabrum]|uniref:peroxisomal membrane protein 2-like n=1 Tax=Corticium candelabrum TaxID=121492 RepID=UPI002E272AF2|nr:peroxisomal membrane protein 2-like [Corticium candelabrum]
MSVADASGTEGRRSPSPTLQQRLLKLLSLYNYHLKKNPVVTKSVTNALLTGLGNFAAQKIRGPTVQWRSVAAFSTFGLVFSGPLFHHFYLQLNKAFPPKSQQAVVKKIFVDRVVFGPPFFVLFFYVIALLEGRGFAAAWQSVKDLLWPALKMSWKVWTVVQAINLKYVPVEYQVLFTSLVSFLWTIYVALLR